MKNLKKLSKPILMLLLIFTCVFTNMAYAMRKEIAYVYIDEHKQYTLFADRDAKATSICGPNVFELVDNFGKVLLGIRCECEDSGKMQWRCIEYGTTEENVIVKECKGKSEETINKFVARGEFSGNRVFSFLYRRCGENKYGFFISNREQGDKYFKVTGKCPYLSKGETLLLHGDTRIVQTSAHTVGVFIPSIVYGMLHQ